MPDWNYIQPEQIGKGLADFSSNANSFSSGLADIGNYLLNQRDRQEAQAFQKAEQDYANTIDAANQGLALRLNNYQNKIQNAIDSIPKPVFEEGNGLAQVSPSNASTAFVAPTNTKYVANVKGAEPFTDLFKQASEAYPEVPLEYLYAITQAESNFNPNAKSHTDVRGLTQMTQATYNDVNKILKLSGSRMLPKNAIMAAAHYLDQLRNQYTVDGVTNWNDVFTHYNGGGLGVQGLKTGNWGKYNTTKQREVAEYAPRINALATAWRSILNRG